MWLGLRETIMRRQGLFRAGLELDGDFGSSVQLLRGGAVQFLLSSVRRCWKRALELKGDNATYPDEYLSRGSCVRAAFSTLAGSWATQIAQNLSWTGVGMLCLSSNHMRESLDQCLPGHAGQPGLQAQRPTTKVQALLCPPVRPGAPQSWPRWPMYHCPEASCSH